MHGVLAAGDARCLRAVPWVLVAEYLPFHVQRPLIERGGGLAGSIGTLIVVEAERGMALINMVVGAALIALTVASFIVRPVWRFEDSLPE